MRYCVTRSLYTLVGTCNRERDKVEGVHEDDGIVWLDFVAHLVPEAISVSAGHSSCYGYIDKGMVPMHPIVTVFGTR